jgi:hypothetical protein
MSLAPWLEGRKSTYRWEDFLNWLDAGFLGPIPGFVPGQPTLSLSSPLIAQMAQTATAWLLTVLAERQQRKLGWKEESDGPLMAAHLTLRLLTAREVQWLPGWLTHRLEEEMRWLIRVLEAPDRVFAVRAARGVVVSSPWQQRCWALAIRLMRVYQVYRAMGKVMGEERARWELQEAAERVRQQVTETLPAA